MTGKINPNNPVNQKLPLPPVKDPKAKSAPNKVNPLLEFNTQEANKKFAPSSLASWPGTQGSSQPSARDIQALLAKFTAGPQVEKIAVIMQDFLMHARKISRNLMLAENTQYVARMEQAKQSVEQQAVWALSGAAMAGISIAGAALNIVGAFKSAAHDKGGLKGLESKIIKFTKENLADAGEGLDTASTRAAISRTGSLSRSGSVRSTASTRRKSVGAEDELEQMIVDTQQAKQLTQTSRKQSAAARVKELSELEDSLSPEQQQVISQLRGALTNESTRILSRYQAASGIVEATGRMLSETMHAMGTFEKATQVQFETAAGAAQFARGASEQMLSSFTDGVHKVQQRVSSIVDSEADTRKHSIRA